MQGAVLRYRVMAYITGVLIIIVVFAGIPLQLAANQTFISNQVATAHGFLYIVYIIVAWLLALRLKLAKGPTVILLLAGTIPVMTFLVERWLTRRYIAPALAAQSAPQPPAGPSAPTTTAGPTATVDEEAGTAPGNPAAPNGRLGQWLHGA